MTKSDLITTVATRAKTTRTAAENVVDLVFDAMKQALLRGERVELRGFASFDVKSYLGYTGRNPRSGDLVEVKPKRLPAFKVGKEMRDRLNHDRDRRSR